MSAQKTTTEKTQPAAIVQHVGVSVSIYEVVAKTTAEGVAYKFKLPGQRAVTRANLKNAMKEAKLAAQMVTQGIADSARVTVGDISDLVAIRRLADGHGVPAVAAMQEWAAAKELTGPALLSIAKQHADAVADGKHKRVTHAAAWAAFIKAKDESGRKGTRVYTSRAGAIMRGLGAEIMLDTLKTAKISAWSSTVKDPVTRNDLLKRLGTMLKWAQRNNLFPADRAIPSANVDRATVPESTPGIVTPAQLKKCLDFIRNNHPQYLAALAMASLAGVRSDEIHGKRSDGGQSRSEMPRQRWDHFRITDTPREDGSYGWFSVSVAKKNTPSNRKIPIRPALAAWLKHCPRDGEYICIAGAMERVRELIRNADGLGLPTDDAGKAVLPGNCFRHSFITYRLPIDGIVSTAAQAGNSPQEIERCYRVPMDIEEASPYWSVMPD